MICMGFAGTGWSPSLHGPALLLVPMVFPPGGLPCPSETHCTIPTSALVFEGNIFMHPCFSTFYGMQIAHGQRLIYLKGFQTINSGNKGMCSKCMAGCVAHCGMWLGGQPRVVCGGWVQDVLLLFDWPIISRI